MGELNICTLLILSNQPTTQPAYHPTSLPAPIVKNGDNFAIFQPIRLKLGMETQYRMTQHMYLIFIHFVGFVIFWS